MASSTTSKTVYKVIYFNHDEIFEVYAANVYASELYGFVEIETWLFGERSQLLVDPAEEKLKNEFAGVTRSYIPMTAIIRIDEVEQQGQAKVSTAQDGYRVCLSASSGQNRQVNLQNL